MWPHGCCFPDRQVCPPPEGAADARSDLCWRGPVAPWGSQSVISGSHLTGLPSSASPICPGRRWTACSARWRHMPSPCTSPCPPGRRGTPPPALLSREMMPTPEEIQSNTVSAGAPDRLWEQQPPSTPAPSACNYPKEFSLINIIYLTVCSVFSKR